jgi:OOP family OmpA-OmpF porin
MRLNFVRLAAAVLLTVAGGAAIARDSGIFVGASAGYSDLEADDRVAGFEFDLDDGDFGYKVFGGYRINDWFGFEAGYVDFGESEGRNSLGKFSVDLSGWDAFLVGSLALGPFEVFGKAGGIYWDAESKLAQFSDDDNGGDFALGVGGALNLGSVGLRAEIEYFDISDVDTLLLYTVGLTITF